MRDANRGRRVARPRPRPTGDGGRRASGPHGLGGEQVEGRRAVLALLGAGRRRVRDVWLADDLADAPILAQIADLAASRSVPVRRVGRPRLAAEARTDAPQGVLAHADPLPEADLEELASPQAGQALPFLLVADGVTDPHNLGALLRTAEAAGATGAVLPRHRAAHVTPTVAKAAAGAVEHLPMAIVAGVPAALRSLGQAGIWAVGLDEDGPTSLFELDLADQPVAVVLGAEGSGLSRLTRARCDVVVSIPMAGRTESLNVASAGALALFEVARRRLH